MAYTYTYIDNATNGNQVITARTANGIGAHYEYDSFGNTITSTRNTRASSPDLRTYNPFRFSSEYFDSELGLIYYNYRHYNPTSGRWISRDPIGEEGGINLYGMCDNNTINSFDIKGLVMTEVTDIDSIKVGDFTGEEGAGSAGISFTLTLRIKKFEYKLLNPERKECDQFKYEASIKELEFKIYMDKEKSYLPFSSLLKHEQGHLAVMKYVYKKWEGKFYELKAEGIGCLEGGAKKDAQQKLKSLFSSTKTSFKNDEVATQRRYDSETTHGDLTREQRRWETLLWPIQ